MACVLACFFLGWDGDLQFLDLAFSLVLDLQVLGDALQKYFQLTALADRVIAQLQQSIARTQALLQQAAAELEKRLTQTPTPALADALHALLTAAEDMGYRRHHHQTPHEFQLTLEGLFPGRLVRMATGAFVNAFYGNHPASDEQISEMSSSVKGLTTGLSGVQSTGSSPDADFRST